MGYFAHGNFCTSLIFVLFAHQEACTNLFAREDNTHALFIVTKICCARKLQPEYMCNWWHCMNIYICKNAAEILVMLDSQVDSNGPLYF